MRKPASADTQTQGARKEIRANIRHTLNTQEIASKLNDGLADTMDVLLEEYDRHPVNKLFKLGRMDKGNPDHWRALVFIMVDEIFGSKGPGAPPKAQAAVKNWELLFYLNYIQGLREEDGYPLGFDEAIADLPAVLKVLEASEDVSVEIAQRYTKTDQKTRKRYVHSALTQGAKMLQTNPKAVDPALKDILVEALDNFRPDWRQASKT
jgi:hypothetical protein